MHSIKGQLRDTFLDLDRAVLLICTIKIAITVLYFALHGLAPLQPLMVFSYPFLLSTSFSLNDRFTNLIAVGVLIVALMWIALWILSFTINAKKELDEERCRSIMVVVFSILNTIDCISYLFSCISSSTIWKWTGAIISFCLVLMIIFESYGSGRKDSKNAKEAGKGYSRDSNAINRTTEEKKIKS